MDTDAVREMLAESRYYAARGDRPPSRELRDVVTMQRTLIDLCRRATSEFLELHDPTVGASAGPPAGYRQSMLEIDQSMLNRGVDLRLLRPRSSGTDPATGYLHRVRDSGAGVRLTRTPPLKLTVVDRRTAMLPLDPDSPTFREGALLIHDPVVVRALSTVHHALWATAAPLGHTTDEPPAHLAPVLELMLAGLPDVAAARRLNVSPRTYTRRISELLTLLGAPSRAMAGAEAERRGWITRPGRS